MKKDYFAATLEFTCLKDGDVLSGSGETPGFGFIEGSGMDDIYD